VNREGPTEEPTFHMSTVDPAVRAELERRQADRPRGVPLRKWVAMNRADRRRLARDVKRGRV
jgi:hypothetical protein